MAIAPHAQVSAADATNGHEPADVLVVFGITGDLAKVMTFHSLYRLEQRGLLHLPIVGVAVDDWSVADLRQRARTSIEAGGEPLDEDVFERLAQRFSYVQGDFGDPATFGRVADALGGARTPVFYLEIPPFLFGTVVAGLADAGLTENARLVVEKPSGHDAASARMLNEEILTRQDSVEETWRVLQPLLDSSSEPHSYAKGSWGPEAADTLVAHYGGWHGPWVGS